LEYAFGLFLPRNWPSNLCGLCFDPDHKP
jgi:hypothetical protein